MTGQPAKTLDPKASRATRRGRPELYTDYRADQAIWNTPAKRFWTLALVLIGLYLPFTLSRDLTALFTLVFIYAIGGIGLNLVTGYAGQVSLGHAFFLGIGAYTAAFLGGEPSGTVRGLELDLLIWLPMAGIVPAVLGLLVAPLAARVRGLYLAILTLGLVFMGEHLFKEARTFTGGPGVGRAPAEPVVFGYNLYARQTILGVELPRESVFYLFCFVVMIAMAILARNLARSRWGRAFAAVRDRDIAAEVMGVPLLRTKTLAFVLSSFYAGIAGALLSVVIGRITPENWNLLLSIDFLAVILIGGIATISGSLIGAAFVVLLPRVVEWASGYVPLIGGAGGGGLISVFQLQGILFGALIVLFIVVEPRGLFGLWLRIRNYWKAWPFSY
jgi:branched-chain amino acid transport system permease protein